MDDLCAKHLLYAHSAVCVHLYALFHNILLHGVIPSTIGCDILIYLIKDKTGDVNSVSNYMTVFFLGEAKKLRGKYHPVVALSMTVTMMSIC